MSHNFCHLSHCSDDDDVCLQKEGNESPQTEKRAEQRALGGQSDNEDKENEPDDEDDEENDDDDDDGGGWITPGNIKQVKMDSADWTAPADIRVGCLTTDFAMQVTDAGDGAFAVFHLLFKTFCESFQ